MELRHYERPAEVFSRAKAPGQDSKRRLPTPSKSTTRTATEQTAARSKRKASFIRRSGRTNLPHPVLEYCNAAFRVAQAGRNRKSIDKRVNVASNAPCSAL